MLPLHAQPNPPPISRELYSSLAPHTGAAELCTVSRQIVTSGGGSPSATELLAAFNGPSPQSYDPRNRGCLLSHDQLRSFLIACSVRKDPARFHSCEPRAHCVVSSCLVVVLRIARPLFCRCRHRGGLCDLRREDETRLMHSRYQDDRDG